MSLPKNSIRVLFNHKSNVFIFDAHPYLGGDRPTRFVASGVGLHKSIEDVLIANEVAFEVSSIQLVQELNNPSQSHFQIYNVTYFVAFEDKVSELECFGESKKIERFQSVLERKVRSACSTKLGLNEYQKARSAYHASINALSPLMKAFVTSEIHRTQYGAFPLLMDSHVRLARAHYFQDAFSFIDVYVKPLSDDKEFDVYSDAEVVHFAKELSAYEAALSG